MHGIPIHGRGVRLLLARQPGLLLLRHVGGQQFFHGGGEVTGVGLRLRNQAFVEGEVDSTFASAGASGGESCRPGELQKVNL